MIRPLVIRADSILELDVNTPYWIEDRSALCNSRLEHFDVVTGLLQFFTTCASSKNTWVQTLMFDGWTELVHVVPPNYPFPEEDENAVSSNASWEEVFSKFPQIVNNNVRVHCNCPAFRWWGGWFNTDLRDSSLYPGEVGPPRVNDVYQQNVVCKHLSSVIHQYF